MNIDYAALVQAVKASHPDILDATYEHTADDPGLITVSIVTRGSIDFGDPVWLAANDAASDAVDHPHVAARLIAARWA